MKLFNRFKKKSSNNVPQYTDIPESSEQVRIACIDPNILECLVLNNRPSKYSIKLDLSSKDLETHLPQGIQLREDIYKLYKKFPEYFKKIHENAEAKSGRYCLDGEILTTTLFYKNSKDFNIDFIGPEELAQKLRSEFIQYLSLEE